MRPRSTRAIENMRRELRHKNTYTAPSTCGPFRARFRGPRAPPTPSPAAPELAAMEEWVNISLSALLPSLFLMACPADVSLASAPPPGGGGGAAGPAGGGGAATAATTGNTGNAGDT